MTRVLLASTTLFIYRTFDTSLPLSQATKRKIKFEEENKSLKPLSRKLKTNSILK